MKSKYFYVLQRSNSWSGGDKYEHLHLSLYQGKDTYNPHPFMTLRWQGSADIEGWYGMHIDLACDGVDDALNRIESSRRVLGMLQGVYGVDAIVTKVTEMATADTWRAPERLERWVRDGCCIRQDDRSGPDVRSAEALIKPLKEPTAQPAEPEQVSA